MVISVLVLLLPSAALAGWTSPRSLGQAEFDDRGSQLGSLVSGGGRPTSALGSECGGTGSNICRTFLFERSGPATDWGPGELAVPGGWAAVRWNQGGSTADTASARSPSGRVGFLYSSDSRTADGHPHLFFRERDPAGVWQETRLSNNLGATRLFGDVTYDANNRATAAYTQTSTTDCSGGTCHVASIVKVSDFPGGATQTLYDLDDSVVTNLSMAGNGSGRQLVVFTRQVSTFDGTQWNTDTRTYYSVREPGEAQFSAPVELAPPAGASDAAVAAVAVSDDGRLAIQALASNAHVAVSEAGSPPSFTWNFSHDGPVSRGLVFADETLAIASWTYSAETAYGPVRLHEHRPGFGWQATTIADSTSPYPLEVGANGRGDLAVAWTTFDSVGSTLRSPGSAAYRPAGEPFEEPVSLGPSADRTADIVKDVAVADDGTATVLFTHCADIPAGTYDDCEWRTTDSGDAANTLVTAGPSGTVKGRTHTFHFDADADADAVGFECRLDGGDWSPCSSPHQLSGLTDGSHTFAVRARSGLSAGPPAEQTFTVDATPPTTTITSGPTGDTTNTSATFEFTSSEAGSTFECSLDDGEFRACASPTVVSDIGPGGHGFRVRATDPVGNTDELGVTRVFNVVPQHEQPQPPPQQPPAGGGQPGGSGAPGPGPIDEGESCDVEPDPLVVGKRQPGTAARACAPVINCPDGRTDRAQAGNVVALARSNAACFTRTRGDEYVTSGPVRVNGINLWLPSGGKLIVEPKQNKVWTTTGGTITFGQVKLPFAKFTWANTAGARSLQKLPIGGRKLGPFVITKPIDLTLTDDDDGTATLNFKDIGLPDEFGARPHHSKKDKVADGEVTASFAAYANGETGLRGTASIKVGHTYLFGRVEARDVTFTINVGTDWYIAGEGTVEIPADIKGRDNPEAVIGLKLKPSSDVTDWKFGASLVVQRINKPLSQGFFLQKLGGEYNGGVGVPDPFYAGTVGISFGPELKLGQQVIPGIASVEGTGKVIWPAAGGLKLSAEGTGKIVNQDITKGSVSWDLLAGETEFSGQVQLAYGGYGFFYTVPKTTITEDEFAMYGYGKLRLPGFGGAWEQDAQILVTRVGSAGCAGPAGKRTGFGYVWGGKLEKFSGSCDVGKWRRDNNAKVVAAQAGERAIELRAGLPLAAIAIRGAGAPPKAVLTGPGGQKVVTPADGSGISTSSVMLVQDPEDSTTYVTLYSPPAGKWTISAAEGSPGITAVETADGLPQPKVKGKVTGRGKARQLDYTVTPIDGQVVRFVETGPGVSRVIGTAKGRGGKLRFRPEPGSGGTRTVVAHVIQHGLPRTTIKIARFKAPKSPAFGTVRRLKAKRRGTSLRLSWQKVAGATGYVVHVKQADGRSVNAEVRRPGFTVRGVPTTTAATVSVVSLGSGGRSSNPATVKVKAVKKKRR